MASTTPQVNGNDAQCAYHEFEWSFGLFLTNHIPATVQNLFQMVSVHDLLIYQLLKSTPNWIIHGVQTRWLRRPVWRLSEYRNICLQERNRCFDLCVCVRWCTVLVKCNRFLYLRPHGVVAGGILFYCRSFFFSFAKGSSRWLYRQGTFLAQKVGYRCNF